MKHHKPINGNSKPESKHVNAFLILDNQPYLLAEYIDMRKFQTVDRSLIKSEINIDSTSNVMQAIIDINIDDIGKRVSNNRPAVMGNTSKHKRLLDLISRYAEHMNHQLGVLRKGIIIKINYQLENCRTGSVIRSAVETVRIPNRNFFLDINPNNIDDNAIIVNFHDTIVSTISEFTHGRDRMQVRITKIQMMYEMVRNRPLASHCNHNPMPVHGSANKAFYKNGYPCEVNGNYPCSIGTGMYPLEMGSLNHCNMYDTNAYPPQWDMFNRFYRFENGGRDIVIHGQEVNDPSCTVTLIPCGSIKVNRLFVINPGHRFIFKFNIWKNDLVVVNDTTRVMQALRIPMLDYGNYDTTDTDDYCCDHPQDIDPDMETLIRMYREGVHMDNHQNCMIDRLINRVEELTSIISDLRKDVDELTTPSDDFDDPSILPTDPEEPDEGSNNDNEGNQSSDTDAKDEDDDSSDETIESLPKNENDDE